MSFGEPSWFWLVPLLLAAAVVHRLRAGWALLATTGGDERLPRSWRARCAPLPSLCELAALLLFVVALARPHERVPAPPAPPGRDLMLCLDTSSSMAAKDLALGRTRLDVGKEVAAAFVRSRTVDRTGFVAFARYADLRCPVTRDHDAVIDLLGRLALVPREGPEDATAIGAAVATAAAALRRSPAKGKVIVLVTDGEENVATVATPREIAPLHAAQLCAAAGVRVHTIVVGRGNQKPDGRFVALDTAAVQQLAATTGGRFFQAEDAQALAAVWAEIDALEAVAFTAPGTVVREWFPAAIGAALLLLGAARVLALTWLRRLP